MTTTIAQTKAPSMLRTAVIYVFGAFLGASLALGAAHVAGFSRPAEPQNEISGDYTALLEAVRADNVAILVRHDCPACQQASAWLTAHGFRARMIDVTREPDHAEAIASAVGVRAVPVLVLADRAVVGWDERLWAPVFRAEPGAQ